MNKIYLPLACILFFGVSCNNAWIERLHQRDQLSVTLKDPDSAKYKVTARPEFDKSRLYEFFFGKKYRDQWTAPVSVKTLNIEEENLSILKKGGGRQTLNLRLMDENENQYVLRSIDKNPVGEMPGFLKRTFVGNIVKDQVSSGHPYGPLTLPVLSDALNIYHTNPQLKLISADESLGKYYDQFAGMLVIMEHRPDEDQTSFDHLGNSKNVVGSHNFLDDLLKENDSKIDKPHYMRTRLFDMLIGDWSRHEDNWRWATYKQDKGILYKAVPRDRDHAYYYIDGVLPRLVRAIGKPHFRSFKKELKGINRLNKSGKSLDKLLLWSSTREDWIKTADSVKMLLSDSIIDEAMTALPEGISVEHGQKLSENLKARRDLLPEKIKRYYAHLSAKPVIYGADKHEKYIITATGGDVLLEIFKTSKDRKKRKLLEKRLFKSSETKKITIYGLAGNDSFIFKGSDRSSIKIRIFGGAGKDFYLQENKKKYLNVKIYDSREGGNTYKLNKGIKVREKKRPVAQNFDANGALLEYYLWD